MSDPSRYRCICLLNHAYKVLSNIILLTRLTSSSDGFLHDWQADFRARRGCRDNTMVLRTLCDEIIRLGKKIAITFIDFTAAFDTVSHKFIDRALEAAGVGNKERSMFRAIYKAASAFTTVSAANGRKVKSECFPVDRGVVQGDITSPLYFILALQLILHMHDSSPDKGVTLAESVVHTLAYADDIALANDGDNTGIVKLSERISSVSAGARNDGDMDVSIRKTKALHVRQQDEVTPTTSEEAKQVCKFVCRHLDCNHCFTSMRGLAIHEAKCPNKDNFKVDKIIACRGGVTKISYLIRWSGYGPEADTWEPRSNLSPELIKEFEISSGNYVFNWKFRCSICDLPCASLRGINIHKQKMHSKTPKDQVFTGRKADKEVQLSKLKLQQEDRPKVYCENVALDNVFGFPYLGSKFTADGDATHDVEERIARALKRWGDLRHIFTSKDLSLNIKIRLYSAAVCSVMTYGCESWPFNDRVMRRINGANSRMLASFTNRTIQQEARPISTSLNLVLRLRRTRLRWLGHILRGGRDQLTFQAVKAQFLSKTTGSLLMDAPPHTCVEDLISIAEDRKGWRALLRNLKV